MEYPDQHAMMADACSIASAPPSFSLAPVPANVTVHQVEVGTVNSSEPHHTEVPGSSASLFSKFHPLHQINLQKTNLKLHQLTPVLKLKLVTFSVK